jgi:hypothetical protein
VQIELFVNADTPEEAAAIADDMARDPSQGYVWDVVNDATGETVQVDSEELESA